MSLILKQFEKNIVEGKFSRDTAQEEAVESLSLLQDRVTLKHNRKINHFLKGLFNKAHSRSTNGIYIWGDVGRGKTYLMDLFFETLSLRKKMRIHFHRLMYKIHTDLKLIAGKADPIAWVARKLAADVEVLCIDEFFVKDIGDAMILGAFLDELCTCGVSLLITSNVEPRDLYLNGLQRKNFLPAIETIYEYCDVLRLESCTDYRFRKLEKSKVYFIHDDKTTKSSLEEIFNGLLSPNEEFFESTHLVIQNRKILAYRYSHNTVWFSFRELCDGPRSQNDYIQISKEYHTVIIENIPELTEDRENMTRRFISLVDEFYDRNVKLIVSAEKPIHELYSGRDLVFEFERTRSRLVEMQSKDYLSNPRTP